MRDAEVSEVRDGARAAVIDAAARLLQEQGARAMTTRAVAEAAGVQAPTIYRLFGDKDGLVDAVAEHVMATYVAAKAAAVVEVEGDPVDDLRAGWQMHLDFGLANSELYLLLNSPGRRGRTVATDAGIEVLRERVRRVAAAGRLRILEERAVQIIHAAGSGTVIALLSTPVHERDQGLPGAMWEAVAAAILNESPVVPDTTLRTIGITFATLLPDLPSLTDAERALMAEWIARSLAAQQDG